MFKRKSCLFQKLYLGLVVNLLIFFSIPCTLFAEKNSVVDEISLRDLLNLEISVATKIKTTVQKAPSIVSVITADEIKYMGAENILQVLNTVVGFDILEENLPMKSIGVRGIASQFGDMKLKIMLDGHGIQTFFGSLSYNNRLVPLDNIRQIEIIRGPGSALYGENAFTAVINIITKKADDSDTNTLSVRYGSYNTVQPSAQLNYKKNDFGLSLYADYYSSDGPEMTVDKDVAYTLFGEDFSASPGEADTRRKQAHLRTLMEYKNFYYSNYYDHMMDSGQEFGASYSLTDESDFNLLCFAQEIGYNGQLSENLNFSVKAIWDYVHSDITVELYDESTSPVLSSMNPDAEPFPENEGLTLRDEDFDTSKTGCEISFDYLPHPGIQLVTGASYEYFEMLPGEKFQSNANLSGRPYTLDGVTYQPMEYLGGLRDVNDVAGILEPNDRTITSLYLQGTADLKELFSLEKIGKNLAVTLGARYDNYDDIGSTTNPRAGIVYGFNDKLYFKALYGEAFRAPSFLDLYMKNNGAVEGNPDLESEKISTLEGMVGYNFTEHLRASLTVYNNRATEIIKGVSTPQGGQHFENVGDIDATGIEFELRAAFDKNKYSYLNFTFLNSENTTGDTITWTDPVTGSIKSYQQKDYKMGVFPDFMLNAGITYGLTEKIIANVNLNYRGKTDRNEEKKFDTKGSLVNVDNRDPADDYFLLNATLTFKDFIPSLKGASFQLSAYNLLDQDYVSPDPTGQLVDDYPMPGIHFMGKISYTF